MIANVRSTDDSVVYNGVIYYQKPLSSLQVTNPSGDQCYPCLAYTNLPLCDKICAYCKQGFVFTRKRSVKVS